MDVSEKPPKRRAIVIGAPLPVYSLGRFFAELVGKSISMNAHQSNSSAVALVFSPPI